jgi:hypothetical protein
MREFFARQIFGHETPPPVSVFFFRDLYIFFINVIFNVIFILKYIKNIFFIFYNINILKKYKYIKINNLKIKKKL